VSPPDYAELHCLSNFTFLRGASHPAELLKRAAELGYQALALTDECSVAGIVRAWEAARESAVALIVGSEFRLEDGLRLVLLATDRVAYGRLCALITRGRRNAEKGSYRLTRSDLETGLEGCLALWLPGNPPCKGDAEWLRATFPERAWIAVELLADGGHRQRLEALEAIGGSIDLPLVAAGDVHMHARGRRAMQDTLTAIRLRRRLCDAGAALYANGERHLRPRERLAAIYPEALMAETVLVARRCRFALDELRYEYPAELVPAGETPTSWLREQTEQGIRRRWPDGITPKTRALIEHELALIAELGYEAYFLTVHDLVRFARAFFVRAVVRPPTQRCVSVSELPRSIRPGCPCCSSASCRRSATSHRISMWISNTSAARK